MQDIRCKREENDGVINNLTMYIVPLIILVAVVNGLTKNIKVFDTFTEGAVIGLQTAVKLVPTLVGLIVAIGMFKASGAMELLVYFLQPMSDLIGLPVEIMPLAILRPVSGTGSLTLVSNIMQEFGADSFIGKLACVMMGSTETTFYVTAIYFGVTKVKNTGYMLPVALFADFSCVLISFFVCKYLFM